jgi:hypothetical protein
MGSVQPPQSKGHANKGMATAAETLSIAAQVYIAALPVAAQIIEPLGILFCAGRPKIYSYQAFFVSFPKNLHPSSSVFSKANAVVAAAGKSCQGRDPELIAALVFGRTMKGCDGQAS